MVAGRWRESAGVAVTRCTTSRYQWPVCETRSEHMGLWSEERVRFTA